MAARSVDDEEAKNKQEELKKEEKENVLPLPPEKPLPGDCCGSGCMRCVWDVYYDELEDYNNLLKKNQNQNESFGSQSGKS